MTPQFASWIEEMEKRSRRRTRDLVTLPAFQGLSENEIGCARISLMARSTSAPFKGRIQKRKTNPLHRSHPACNTRPVHTVGSISTFDGYAPQRPILLQNRVTATLLKRR